MAKKSAASSSVNLDPSMRIVVLYGKERFLIEEHTRRFIQMLEEQFGGVEVFTFDGETVDPASVLDELRSYGLMQQHKVVVLENADIFLAGRKVPAGDDADDDDDAANDDAGEDDDAVRESRRPLMERYASNPVADATLIMRARSWRKGKLDKLIEKHGSINLCEIDVHQAPGWCIKRCGLRYETKLELDAAELLVERIGPDLLHLDTELMKLAAMAGSGQSITRDLVIEAVGLSREEQAWAIQDAVVTLDPGTMLRKLNELMEISRRDLVPLTWAVTDLLRKMHLTSQLLRRHVPPRAIMGQARLWGSVGEQVLRIAQRTEPDVLAQLLQQAIETDQRGKSGYGEPRRSLEVLLVKIADTLAPASAAAAR